MIVVCVRAYVLNASASYVCNFDNKLYNYVESSVVMTMNDEDVPRSRVS